MTGASLRLPGCQWQWASRRDSGSTWNSLGSARGMSKRLGTRAETMVMAWPFFRSGCGSKGGMTKSTTRLYFRKDGGGKLKASPRTSEIWFLVYFQYLFLYLV